MCEFVGIPGEQVALFNGAADAEVALHVQALAEDAVAAAHLSQAAALHRRRDGRTAHVVSGRPCFGDRPRPTTKSNCAEFLPRVRTPVH
jgi:hypothetical protein